MMNLRTCISGVRHLSTSRALCNAPKPGLENYARVVDSIKNDKQQQQQRSEQKPKKKLNLRKKTVASESYAPGQGRVAHRGMNQTPRVDRRVKFGNASSAINDNIQSTNYDAGNDKYKKRRTPLDKKVVPKRYGQYKADEDRKAPRKLFRKNDREVRPERKRDDGDGKLTEFVTVAENARLQAALNDLDFENKDVSKAFATLITSEQQPRTTKINTSQMFSDAFDPSKSSPFKTGVAKPAKASAEDFVVRSLNQNYSLSAEQATTLLDIVSGKTPIASLKMKEEK